MNKIIIIIMSITICFFCIILSSIILFSKENFNPECKYMIILGAKVKKQTPTKSLKYRMDTALKFLKKYPEMKVITTGGQGYDEEIEEAIAIKNYLIKNGLEINRIIVEDKSTNTFENFKCARKLIKKNGLIPVNIVSNRYHLLRASIIARRNGFKPYCVPAPTPKKVLLQSYFRETLAFIKSYLFDKN